MTFEEWWEANDMDEVPYADRTSMEEAWNAAKLDAGQVGELW